MKSDHDSQWDGETIISPGIKNPREKALELIAKFQNPIIITKKYDDDGDTIHFQGNIIRDDAKRLALICIDEILGYMGADRGYAFWIQVKEEIKKL